MYTTIWNKYLPIIKILLKKTANSDQTLNLNTTDFERAGASRKAGYKFNIEFSEGRVSNIISASELAKSLASVLLQDAVVKELFSHNDYHISMNTKFQLAMKMIPVAVVEEETNTEAEPATADTANR